MVVGPTRPSEFAIDLVIRKHRHEATIKPPAAPVTDFRTSSPLPKPLHDSLGLKVVFPGPEMIEVSEREVLGVPEDPACFQEGPPMVPASNE